jgi:hypothetical protein
MKPFWTHCRGKSHPPPQKKGKYLGKYAVLDVCISNICTFINNKMSVTLNWNSVKKKKD